MSLYNKAKTIFLASGAAGKPQTKRGTATGTAHTVKPVEILSNEELVKNGTFLGEDFWSLGENISISADGFAVFDEVDGYHSMSTNEDNRIFKLGKTYKVSFEVSDFRGEGPSAALLIQEYPNRNPAIATVESNGKYSFIYRSVGPESGDDVGKDARLIIKNNGANSSKVSCKISNVSVREVYSKPVDINTKRDTDLSGTRYVAAGSLIEKGRQNLLKQSNQFDKAINVGGWGKTGDTDINHTAVVTSGEDGYDGSTNAFKVLAEDTNDDSSGDQRCFVFQNITTSGLQTLSVYVKGGNVNFVRTIALSSGGNAATFFSLTGDGAVGHKTSGVINASIESVGDDWYRVSSTFDRTLHQVRIYVADGDGLTDTDEEDRVTEGDYIFIQNAQLEAGQVATNYIDNDSLTRVVGVGLDEPRYDYFTSDSPCYLLEPPRTNLVDRSELYSIGYSKVDVTVNDNTDKSPEGYVNASTIVPNTADDAHFIMKNNIPVVVDESYTWSAFVKADGYGFAAVRITAANGCFTAGSVRVNLTTGDITVEDSTVEGNVDFYGNGWYRISATGKCIASGNASARVQVHNAATGGEDFAGDGTKGIQVYGVQFEQGGYATSYIPTYGSTVTRTQDNTSSSHWNNIDKGLLDLSKSWGVYLSLGKTKMYADRPASIPLFVFYTSGNKESVSLFCNTQNTGTADDPVYEHGLNLYLLNQGGYVFSTIQNDALDANESKVCVTYNHVTKKLAYYINGTEYGSTTKDLDFGPERYGYITAGFSSSVPSDMSAELRQMIFFDKALTPTEAEDLTDIS